MDALAGLERCGYMRINYQEVNDVHCDLRGPLELIIARYICERTLGSLQQQPSACARS